MPKKRFHETARFESLKHDAYIGLRNRTVEPLIEYLIALEATAERDVVFASDDGEKQTVIRQQSPLVRELRLLANGSADETEIQLQFVVHPNAQKGHLSREARRAQQGVRTTTAIMMVKSGALVAGGFESAVKSTMTKTNLSRATVIRHWSREKTKAEYLVRVGLA
ncbi:hypothetical protein [Sphingomonas sp.]|uniref:hypothetical protein n=1 Tax=Sphingomonas sp. TaxID=28214 RepID=UPI00333FA30A